MKINLPDELAEKMALFPATDFQKMAVESIEKYVNQILDSTNNGARRLPVYLWMVEPMISLLFFASKLCLNVFSISGRSSMKKLIAPSILSANFACLEKEIKAVEAAGADYIHIDVMDGHFVPNITVGTLIVEAAKRCTALPLDVHLMIENPDFYIDEFAKAGSSVLTVHPETCRHLQRTLQCIKDKGMKPAVALNPATPLCALEHVLADVEMILIMTVNPGFGGQKFISTMLPKIEKLKKMLTSAGSIIPVEVDGGIVVANIAEVAKAGGDIFVSGSGIFKTGDYKKTISEMKKRINP